MFVFEADFQGFAQVIEKSNMKRKASKEISELLISSDLFYYLTNQLSILWSLCSFCDSSWTNYTLSVYRYG